MEAANAIIAEVKTKYQEVTFIGAHKMRLLHNDCRLADGRTLSDYNIQEDATLRIVTGKKVLVSYLIGQQVQTIELDVEAALEDDGDISIDNVKAKVQDRAGIHVRGEATGSGFIVRLQHSSEERSRPYLHGPSATVGGCVRVWEAAHV